MSRRHRRNFVLDSGGVSWLAQDQQAQTAMLKHVVDDYEDAAILVPSGVLAECFSGYPGPDVKINRLLKAIGDPADPDGFIPRPTIERLRHAGALRSEAITVGNKDVTATDAEVVALADELSYSAAVTIYTSDRKDIPLLVDLTRRTNIAVEFV